MQAPLIMFSLELVNFEGNFPMLHSLSISFCANLATVNVTSPVLKHVEIKFSKVQQLTNLKVESSKLISVVSKSLRLNLLFVYLMNQKRIWSKYLLKGIYWSN